MQSAIKIVANENRYHPVRDYLDSLQWDGTERIRYALHHFLGADTDEYTYEALKLFLMGAIRRVFRPGSKFEVMLCLVGGQGAGKSTFFRLLAGRDEWFSDDLKKLDDENVYRKLQGHWIIEMSEMIATANAKSIEEIKSFLSRQKETYKVPYETHPACLLYTSSPDLNPIEKMWSKLKAFLRKEKIRMASELPSAISKGFLTIRPTDCIGWFHSCNYVQ